MSWSISNTGSKETVIAAIDEAIASQSGLPPGVVAYLKDAIEAIELKPGFLVRVESSGHRPMQGVGSSEVSRIELVKSGPWNLGQ